MSNVPGIDKACQYGLFRLVVDHDRDITIPIGVAVWTDYCLISRMATPLSWPSDYPMKQADSMAVDRAGDALADWMVEDKVYRMPLERITYWWNHQFVYAMGHRVRVQESRAMCSNNMLLDRDKMFDRLVVAKPQGDQK